MKVCSQCAEIKEEKEFCKNTANKTGLNAACKKCTSARCAKWRMRNPEKKKVGSKSYYWKNVSRRREYSRLYRLKNLVKVRESVRKWSLANREKKKLYARKRNLIRLYNLTLAQWHERLATQNNCCAFCNKNDASFTAKICVDHDHITNKVRGFTCDTCNRLFISCHTLATARSLVAYLEKYETS